MKTSEAISILSIVETSISLDALKKAYRKACKIFHPDINPTGEKMMKIVNSAYDFLKGRSFPIELEKESSTTSLPIELEKALNAVISLKGIDIEVCGVWIWISGDTKPHKEAFKVAGYKWSGKKKMWYFRVEAQGFKGKRRAYSMDKIRTLHGSQSVQTKTYKKLA